MFIGKEGVMLMTEKEFKEILDKEETDTVEFKSWINTRNMKEIISLAVDELIAFANTKGGTVYFGVEDKPIEVTGCDRNYDGQRIIEGIYDRTVPPLFTEISDLKYVQRTGQGVDIIFKDMVSMGKPYPRYRSFNDAVSLTIFSAIDNTEFVKFITEVQDKNSKIMPLAEMMILRDLMDNRKEQLSELSRKVQKSLDETKKSCNELVNGGLIEIVGKEYMLTAKVYEALKSDVEYTRDKTVQYIKAKNMILEYLQINGRITSAKIQEMCGFTKQQARSVIDKMRSEELITLTGKGPAARYVMHK